MAAVIGLCLLTSCQKHPEQDKSDATQNHKPAWQQPDFDGSQVIKKITATPWQFEKAQNVTDAWLTKLDGRAVLKFYDYSPEMGEVKSHHDWLLYSFSVYVGCATVNSVIGMDKYEPKFHPTQVGYLGNAPYCEGDTEMEIALAKFIGGDVVDYVLSEHYLILQDSHHQTLYFKPKAD